MWPESGLSERYCMRLVAPPTSNFVSDRHATVIQSPTNRIASTVGPLCVTELENTSAPVARTATTVAMDSGLVHPGFEFGAGMYCSADGVIFCVGEFCLRSLLVHSPVLSSTPIDTSVSPLWHYQMIAQGGCVNTVPIGNEVGRLDRSPLSVAAGTVPY